MRAHRSQQGGSDVKGETKDGRQGTRKTVESRLSRERCVTKHHDSKLLGAENKAKGFGIQGVGMDHGPPSQALEPEPQGHPRPSDVESCVRHPYQQSATRAKRPSGFLQ